jgi:hypothetical protein
MLTLEDMIVQHDLQHEIRKAYEARLHALDNGVPINSAGLPPLGTQCGIIRDHDCFDKNHTYIEGRLITLWAHLQFPEDRAWKNMRNIRRFRKAKAKFGMGNGRSPLKHEVNPEDIQAKSATVTCLHLNVECWAEEDGLFHMDE